MADKQNIVELINGWALWRDSGNWENLVKVWHPGGRIATTWFKGSFEDFIVLSKRAWEAGAVVHHIQGGSVIDIAGPRAVAQTRMTLCMRGNLDGVECDVQCIGRFYDFFEKREDGWGLILRQPIYEKDRLDPVDPSASVRLKPELLEKFPMGYRHLAYLQSVMGMTVAENLPGLRGPVVERVYENGNNWLRGLELDL